MNGWGCLLNVSVCDCCVGQSVVFVLMVRCCLICWLLVCQLVFVFFRLGPISVSTPSTAWIRMTRALTLLTGRSKLVKYFGVKELLCWVWEMRVVINSVLHWRQCLSLSVCICWIRLQRWVSQCWLWSRCSTLWTPFLKMARCFNCLPGWDTNRQTENDFNSFSLISAHSPSLYLLLRPIRGCCWPSLARYWFIVPFSIFLLLRASSASFHWVWKIGCGWSCGRSQYWLLTSAWRLMRVQEKSELQRRNAAQRKYSEWNIMIAACYSLCGSQQHTRDTWEAPRCLRVVAAGILEGRSVFSMIKHSCFND